MNHQTAKIIAEAYHSHAEMLERTHGHSSLRSELAYDHAAVWERVALDLAAKEPPHAP